MHFIAWKIIPSFFRKNILKKTIAYNEPDATYLLPVNIPQHFTGQVAAKTPGMLNSP